MTKATDLEKGQEVSLVIFPLFSSLSFSPSPPIPSNASDDIADRKFSSSSFTSLSFFLPAILDTVEFASPPQRQKLSSIVQICFPKEAKLPKNWRLFSSGNFFYIHRWNYGGGQPTGTVEAVVPDHDTIETKGGKEVSRNGSKFLFFLLALFL